MNRKKLFKLIELYADSMFDLRMNGDENGAYGACLEYTEEINEEIDSLILKAIKEAQSKVLKDD